MSFHLQVHEAFDDANAIGMSDEEYLLFSQQDAAAVVVEAVYELVGVLGSLKATVALAIVLGNVAKGEFADAAARYAAMMDVLAMRRDLRDGIASL